jgi:hypothetical protein
LSSDPEIVYAKNSDFVQKTKKKKKNNSKKRPVSEIEKRAKLYLTKQQNKSQSLLKKAAKKDETKKDDAKKPIEDLPRDEQPYSDQEDHHKYKIYTEVMADLDPLSIGRPSSAIPGQEKEKRNKSKNNNICNNFQIYQKKPKI